MRVTRQTAISLVSFVVVALFPCMAATAADCIPDKYGTLFRLSGYGLLPACAVSEVRSDQRHRLRRRREIRGVRRMWAEGTMHTMCENPEL